jgi:D-beta-D-heptose 7-phosphate kinase/D-beta-D-heptose 1-phosphate adenosyltransferase
VGRVLSWDEAARWREEQRAGGRRVVFTNGVFDLLHAGHVDLLERARALGDVLVVALNTDASTRRLKGDQRPILPEDDRARVMAALAVVDVVVLFDEDTPEALVSRLAPDILVKGADYEMGAIAGREAVEQGGGQVVRLPLVEGRSTSAIVDDIVRRDKGVAKDA